MLVESKQLNSTQSILTSVRGDWGTAVAWQSDKKDPEKFVVMLSVSLLISYAVL